VTRLEDILVAIADPRIETIRGDDQVGIGILQIALDIGLELEFDAELLAALLEDVEQPLAADADKAVTGGTLPASLEPDFDIVPMIEGILDNGGAFGIPRLHRLHRRVREDDAPAECVIGAVAFDDGNGMFRMKLLHQKPEIEAGRAAADTYDPHVTTLFSVGPAMPSPNILRLK
jgi:hypothetical protein